MQLKGASRSSLTLEERVAVVEAEIEALKQKKQDKEVDKSDDAIPWWQRIVGIYADSPAFEEAVRYGREWRESEDPSEEDPSDDEGTD